jgi:hypothetical protein
MRASRYEVKRLPVVAHRRGSFAALADTITEHHSPTDRNLATTAAPLLRPARLLRAERAEWGVARMAGSTDPRRTAARGDPSWGESSSQGASSLYDDDSTVPEEDALYKHGVGNAGDVSEESSGSDQEWDEERGGPPGGGYGTSSETNRTTRVFSPSRTTRFCPVVASRVFPRKKEMSASLRDSTRSRTCNTPLTLSPTLPIPPPINPQARLLKRNPCWAARKGRTRNTRRPARSGTGAGAEKSPKHRETENHPSNNKKQNPGSRGVTSLPGPTARPKKFRKYRTQGRLS